MLSCLRFLFAFALLMGGGGASGNQSVILLVAEQKPAAREFAEAFLIALRRIAPMLTVRETLALDQSESSPSLIVAVVSRRCPAFSSPDERR